MVANHELYAPDSLETRIRMIQSYSEKQSKKIQRFHAILSFEVCGDCLPFRYSIIPPFLPLVMYPC